MLLSRLRSRIYTPEPVIAGLLIDLTYFVFVICLFGLNIQSPNYFNPGALGRVARSFGFNDDIELLELFTVVVISVKFI
jgi:hypothetical protein